MTFARAMAEALRSGYLAPGRAAAVQSVMDEEEEDDEYGSGGVGDAAVAVEDLVVHWFCCFLNEALAPSPPQPPGPEPAPLVSAAPSSFSLFASGPASAPPPSALDKKARFAFENDYFVDGVKYMLPGATRHALPRNTSILRVLDEPPHFKVMRYDRQANSSVPVEVAAGEANVWHTIVLFLKFLDEFENGRVASIDTSMLLEQVGVRTASSIAASTFHLSPFASSFEPAFDQGRFRHA